MIVLVAFVICIAGAIIYAISNNGKAQALALHMFWVGLFITLLLFGNRTVHIP
jgi:hypothetical protein